jgi:hypothetical protein
MPEENQSSTVLAPRPGKEFWDKLNALPRYMFLLKPSDAGIQKLEDRTGNWIDVHEAQQVVDQAQENINQLRAERDALQLRLNAADERIDQLATPPAIVPELTAELRYIFGMMCFQCITPAQALRRLGHSIAKKAEDEQAATIHWMFGHYMKDPANWRQNATADLKQAAAVAEQQ